MGGFKDIAIENAEVSGLRQLVLDGQQELMLADDHIKKLKCLVLDYKDLCQKQAAYIKKLEEYRDMAEGLMVDGLDGSDDEGDN